MLSFKNWTSKEFVLLATIIVLGFNENFLSIAFTLTGFGITLIGFCPNVKKIEKKGYP